VGSTKPNIGHLEGASGLAGLIKAVLSLEKGVIAPNIRFQKGNPAIDFEGWRIRVPTEATPWPVPGLRRASVNSFGYGGTNGHVIVDDAYHYLQLRGLRGKHCTNLSSPLLLEVDSDDSSVSSRHTRLEAADSGHLTIPTSSAASSTWTSSSRASSRSTSRTCSVSPDRRSSSRSRATSSFSAKNGTPRIFHVSANDEKQLKKLAAIYAEHIHAREDDDDEFMADLAFTLCQRRSLLSFGASMVASTKLDLVAKLESLSNVIRRPARAPKLGFIFTGQGAQWFAMGRKMAQHPVFEATLLACGRSLRKLGADWSIFVELLRSERESRIDEASISQPLCTAVQIALVDLYASWGIHATSVVGHSSGEIAAAYTTGAISLESAMCVAYWRGLLASDVKNLAPPGSMMAAGLSEEDAKTELEQLGEEARGKIGIACINSPRSVTISGDAVALTKLQRSLTARGLFARKLQVDTAYHSHHMLTIADEYRDLLADIEVVPMAQRKPVCMFSSVTTQPIVEEDLDAAYWVRNMVSCVRFSDALGKLCNPLPDNDGGIDLLIELGPHSALAGPTKQILAEMPKHIVANIKYFSALIRGIDASISMLDVAAELFARGYPVDTTAAQCPLGGSTDLSVLVDLPSYVWNHDRTYWHESRMSHDYLQRKFPRTDLLGAPFHDWNPIEPHWRNFIRLSEQPWVKSHVVQGAVLYPAAGFCCMALEAAAQMSKISGRWEQATEIKLREISIARALVVPQTEEGIEVIFTMRPCPTSSVTSSDSWNEFRVFSCTGDRDWAEHCRGQVSVVYNKPKSNLGLLVGTDATLDAADSSLDVGSTIINGEDIYKHLDAAGLTYGPEFQGIIDASVRDGRAFGSVRVTDTRSGMPKQYEHERIVHPATLDALLQMCIVALSQGDLNSLQHPYVPTFIQEVIVSRDIASEAGQQFEVTAEGRLHGFREAFASVSAVQEHSSKPAVQMKNIKCMAIAASGSGDTDTLTRVPKHCFTVVWEPDVELISRDSLSDWLRDPAQSSHSRVKDLELLAYYFLDQTLKEVKEKEMADMLPHHQKFFRYMLHQREMVRTNTHEQQTDEWAKLDFVDTASKIQSLIKDLSDPADYEGRMFTRMGQALSSVLRQQVDPLSVMLEDNLLYDYYSVSLGVHVTYPQVAKYVGMLSHKNPDLCYLEIGAGTGGLTAPVLEALGGYDKHKYPRFKSYTFTDISTGFFEQATDKFNDWTDLMEFKKLDAEQDPESQGFVAGAYDVILAANVLHATFDIEKTIRNARTLLKPGGKLIILDMTHSLLSVSLIWGNLPGWWNCSEPWREYGPLLNENQWQQVVQKHGFAALDASSPDFLDPLEENTRVMIATAVEEGENTKLNRDSIQRRVFIIKPENQSSRAKDIIQESTIVLNRSGISTEICSLLELENKSTKDTIVISFAELEDPVLMNIKPSTLILLQRVSQESAGLLWVTCGANDGSRPELSLFHGLSRSLRSEQEDFRCITLDFNTDPLPPKQTASLIRDVFEKNLSENSLNGVVDREYVEKRGVIHIKRVIEDAKLNQYIAARTESTPLEDTYKDIFQSEHPLKLKVKTLGSLDSFVFDRDIAMEEPVADGEVEVDVRAVGLNFRDVLISMGEISDNYLGNECSGFVTKLGKGVEHLAVGDRVAVWCVGCFSTRMRNPACCVQRIPDSMDFSTAASLPLVYVTAFYGLIHVANLSAGETVLIHAAAGGVGQAAVQLAKVVGAKVLVTVGTEEKKKHIMETYGVDEDCVFSSRDLSFVEGVQKVTGGRGVDVVLNSLAGEALQATWKCIAPFGRFVEIGKRDIDANGKLDMQPFSRNVTFTSVDVTVILRQNLRLAEQMFSSVMAMVKNGHITAPTPLTVQPFSKIEETFRTMQAGKHIGKIVLEPRVGDLVPVGSSHRIRKRITTDMNNRLSQSL
jgi:acyl transferase domain-containing protein/NADPH:quinone reductase-like Zn-dependent oxidoreductase/ubiquinone/menaquinone biosynthesis C-methylase UbiE